MEKSHIVVFVLFMFPLMFGLINVNAAGTNDGSETWDYVEVRPKAHIFWWYYKSPHRTEDSSKPWPIILWLQGGPGASGVGLGNFAEIGPLDRYLKPRNSTWLQMADLLFVDSPIGTGYSYVDDADLLLQEQTDEDAATDLTALLISVFNRNKKLQKNPLYIVAESYGGKFAVTLGLSALKAIENRTLKAKLGGIVLGNTWISPEDFVFSWGPLLKDVSRLDNNGLRESNRLADQIKKQLEGGQFENATNSWGELEEAIFEYSNGVNFYNFLLDSGVDPLSTTTATSMKQYSNYLASLRSTSSEHGGGQDGNLTRLMNEEIKEKLMIIPKDVTWMESSEPAFYAFEGEFMKPRVDEVDQLLSKGVNVTIYSGQLDVICSTKGTEAWVEKLKWDGIQTFLSNKRTPIISCGEDQTTRGFVKSFKNLKFYWILQAGHYAPVEQPCATLNIIADITSSPAARKIDTCCWSYMHDMLRLKGSMR